MAYVLSSISGNLISAASAGYAPTNSGDVSAIASAYQVVSATATQLYAGTAYVTSVNEAPISAARAGNAANASLANSAWYDGTGRFISALPDSAAVSAIASSYVESGVSSKQDTLSFAYNGSDQISSINGSALGGMDDNAVSAIASAYAESAASGKQNALTFGYDTANAISSINGSSLAGEGGGGLVTAIGTSESGITSINNSGLVDTAALRSADYSSLYVQEPLYISASGDSSYIGISGNVGGVDSATCSAIASSYAESAVSSYQPLSGMSGYASAFSAGEGLEFVQSGSDQVLQVEAPVDIVAGPGIVIDNPDGNTLRVSVEADAETVLWEGNLNTLNSDVSCSESIYNFDRIKVFYRIVADSIVQSVAVHEFEPSEISSTSFVSFGSFYLISNGWYGWWLCRLSVTDNNKIKITKTLNSYGNGASPAGMSVDSNNIGFIYKVVGIHRIANN